MEQLNIGKVFNRAWNAIGQNIYSYIIVVADYLLILGALGGLFAVSMMLVVFGKISADFHYMISSLLFRSLPALIIVFVCTIIIVIGSIIYNGILNEFSSQIFQGYKPDLGVALQWSKRRFWSYFLVSVIVGLVVGFGFLLLIIPGIVFMVMFSLAPYIIAREKVDVMTALSRSWQLASQNFFGIFLIGLILVIAGAVIGAVVGWVPIVGQIIVVLFGVVWFPVFAAVYEEIKRASPKIETKSEAISDKETEPSHKKSARTKNRSVKK